MGVTASRRSFAVALAEFDKVWAAIETGDKDETDRAISGLFAEAWLAGVRDTFDHLAELAARRAQPVGLGNRRT